MTSGYTYRVLGPDDQPEFRALRLEALELFPRAFLTTVEQQKARSEEKDRELLSYGRVRGLYSGNMLIGLAALLPNTHPSCAHRAEIGMFYVTPAHQGGPAATSLLQSIAQEALDAGRWQLELFVEYGNARARAFYERQGFVCVGRLPNSANVDGEYVSDDFMVSDLRR